MSSKNMIGDSPLFSIVIPTRNESEDVARTLEAVLAISYEPKEIIVVDDSTDETPEIISRYASRGVRLIHRAQNRNGCCGARNLGMQMAKGEVVVIFNADNLPRSDFIHRLLSHYQNGADYVIVKSVVLNRENPWGKYTFAAGMAWLNTNPCMEWSEGFSCRRVAAEAVGYIPGDFPVPFCRDWMIGATLNEAGFKKHVDLNIEIEHIAPATLNSYWHNQTWRGTFSAPYSYYIGKKSLPVILIREILKAGRTFLKYLLILPVLLRAVRLSRYVGHWRDVPVIFFVSLIQDVAMTVGNAKGFIRLFQALLFNPSIPNQFVEPYSRSH